SPYLHLPGKSRALPSSPSVTLRLTYIRCHINIVRTWPPRWHPPLAPWTIACFRAWSWLKAPGARAPSQVTSKPTIGHVRSKRRARPSLRDPRAGRVARAGRVQLPAQRKRVSARVPDRLAARDGDAAPLRGQLRRRTQPRRGATGLPADAGALPALLRGRQPRALRTRSAHVRRPAAVLRQHPLHARGGRLGHRCEGRR